MVGIAGMWLNSNALIFKFSAKESFNWELQLGEAQIPLQN
jgi:hypothetical protein